MTNYSNDEKVLILNGTLDIDEGTITELNHNSKVVWDFNELARSFNNKDVSIIIKENTKEESLSSYEYN